MRPHRRKLKADRGQANVLSVILVMAVTVLGITGIVWFGISALDTAQYQSNMQNAEQSMTSLDTQASLVGLGSSSVKHVNIHAGEEQLRVDRSAGWMNVSVINSTTGGVDLVVMNTPLGAVEYQNDQTTIAYQGGAVWKYQQVGSVMVSPPEFHYRIAKTGAPTLTLPLVIVEGGGSISGNIRSSTVWTIYRVSLHLPASLPLSNHRS